ncbi:MAG TPA: Crp/Fnr family transcriptional regulator [Thermoanaerobaculia bacterium]|nr:Crp/Fnr family transcriptional regulator [Thermoanaerobaculia bacterium]
MPAQPIYDRLFEGFAPAESERVLAAAAPRVLRKGEVLFREGEPAAALYLVESGRIKLTQLTGEGGDVIMRYLAPGDAFAAVALFERSTYPVTARATERTRVRAWPREVLPGVVREHPRFEANLLRIVSSHTREALSRVRELATEPVAQRLARALLRLAKQIGRGEADGSVVVERITQQEIAEISGASLYTVSRTLADWEKEKIVETGRQRFRIRDEAALARISEPGPTSSGG